jgi:trk system potassium uptake protein TrkH
VRKLFAIRTLGVLVLLFSTTIIPPLALSLFTADGLATHFGITLLASLVVGFGLWAPTRTHKAAALRTRDGFLVVALMWTGMSLLGMIPFMLALDLSPVEALFESASGYTTTGSTVLTGLDSLPKSILFYRQELQWLGGIGVIVVAIALLPMLQIGGMQLYRAETPGPFKDNRITPRINKTAKNICIVYGTLTAAGALAYWLAGMDAFDAIAHSMSTLSTGGYSTHDASLAYFNSPAINAVAIVFMLVGAISFSVHFIAWRQLQPGYYGRDGQTRTFLLIALVVSTIVAFQLLSVGTTDSVSNALELASFEVVSVISSTGFGVADFASWPLDLPVLLIFLSFIGGCAGSTAGGIKVIRFLVLEKQARSHVRKLVHPSAMMPIRIDNHVVDTSVIEGIWGFFTVYVAIFATFMLILMLDGMDQVTAFGAVASCLNNLGPGLGDVALNFAGVSSGGKLLLVLAMIFGRLEIFTVLVLLTPGFWRD